MNTVEYSLSKIKIGRYEFFLDELIHSSYYKNIYSQIQHICLVSSIRDIINEL